ncbi:hypothetical protein AAY473_024139, partial [Plecturocebus cupreus]
MPVPHRAGPSRVRCACCETLSPQRFQLLFSLWGWDQPSPSIPYTPPREAPCWGTGKTAAQAKRVALATRVAPLSGISRSVGNKNSSETLQKAKVGRSQGQEIETILANMIVPSNLYEFGQRKEVRYGRYRPQRTFSDYFPHGDR